MLELDDPNHCLEAHLARHSGRGNLVYLTVLVLVIAALVALPVVRVPISVSGEGILRPELEKHSLRLPVSGFAEVLHIAENRHVDVGEELARVRVVAADGQRELLERRIAEGGATLRDLRMLLAAPQQLDTLSLETPRYRLAAAELSRRHAEAMIEIADAENDVRRATLLAERRLLPLTELEDSEGRLRKAREQASAIEQGARMEWTSAAEATERELRELAEELNRLRAEAALRILRAPVAGTLEQVASVSPGSYLLAGDPLLTISPTAPLRGEVYVATRDIGMLRAGMPVRLLVDAFDHHDWGAALGRIASIAEDYLPVDGVPAFRVIVELDNDVLTGPGGIRGKLRKGMTLQARFDVTERSLWQLLRDDVEDWIDPVRNS